jgi:hypothetical protein
MAAPSVDDLGRSFERYLWAGNRSPRTNETDHEAVRGFAAHLAGRPVVPSTRHAVRTSRPGSWVRGCRGLEALMEESVDALAGPRASTTGTGPRCATATSGAR